MVVSTASELDRRGRRRQQTIDEILDISLELMAEEGVAALSLSAVARRVGMRPPSLYQYFGSKMAIYDALFERGAQQILEVRRAAAKRHADADPVTRLKAATTEFGRWAMQNQVHSQLLFWRTVPGFEPSPEAFAPAIDLIADLQADLQAAVDAGQLTADAASEEGIALFTSLGAGLLSQQFANEPDASFEDGRYARLLPTVLDMFVERYTPRGK